MKELVSPSLLGMVPIATFMLLVGLATTVLRQSHDRMGAQAPYTTVLPQTGAPGYRLYERGEFKGNVRPGTGGYGYRVYDERGRFMGTINEPTLPRGEGPRNRKRRDN